MRLRLALAVSALALVSACGSPALPGQSPAAPPPPSEGSAAPSCVDSGLCNPESPAASPQVVFLHGEFTGHFSDFLATADQTVQVEVRWNVGPDDVHDRDAFVFTSGSYTFSETISGVCGGSRSEGGPLILNSNQFLISSDPQDRDQARVSIIDRRRTDAGVEFSLSSGFRVPNPDTGCEELSESGVPSCRLLFLQTAADRLQTDAACTQGTLSWTGHLDQ